MGHREARSQLEEVLWKSFNTLYFGELRML